MVKSYRKENKKPYKNALVQKQFFDFDFAAYKHSFVQLYCFPWNFPTKRTYFNYSRMLYNLCNYKPFGYTFHLSGKKNCFKTHKGF